MHPCHELIGVTPIPSGQVFVDEYIDEFEELIEKAEYMDGLAIVMKFWQGLKPSI